MVSELVGRMVSKMSGHLAFYRSRLNRSRRMLEQPVSRPRRWRAAEREPKPSSILPPQLKCGEATRRRNSIHSRRNTETFRAEQIATHRSCEFCLASPRLRGEVRMHR